MVCICNWRQAEGGGPDVCSQEGSPPPSLPLTATPVFIPLHVTHKSMQNRSYGRTDPACSGGLYPFLGEPSLVLAQCHPGWVHTMGRRRCASRSWHLA